MNIVWVACLLLALVLPIILYCVGCHRIGIAKIREKSTFDDDSDRIPETNILDSDFKVAVDLQATSNDSVYRA